MTTTSSASRGNTAGAAACDARAISGASRVSLVVTRLRHFVSEARTAAPFRFNGRFRLCPMTGTGRKGESATFGCSRSAGILSPSMLATFERTLSPSLTFEVASAKVNFQEVDQPFVQKTAADSYGSRLCENSRAEKALRDSTSQIALHSTIVTVGGVRRPPKTDAEQFSDSLGRSRPLAFLYPARPHSNRCPP